jgi:MFS family permease
VNRRQFGSLFLCSLVTWWVGAGLMPLLPIYAARLGASPVMVGNYLSAVFLSLAIGTIAGGWISSRIPRYRDLLMLMGIIAAPSTWLMGQVSAIWQLLLLNATVWFVAGVILTLIAIVVGQNAAPHERGRIFGLLGITSALGGVLGGPTGLVVDHWGYVTLFTLIGCSWLVLVGAASLLDNGKKNTVTANPATATSSFARPDGSILLLLSAALFFSTGNFFSILGRSLAMDHQGFTAAALTLTAALGATTGLILNPVIGYLSDRVNRCYLLCLIYAVGGLALAMLATTTSLVGYAIAAVLMTVGGTERAVSSALVSDLLPPHALNRGLSLLDAAKWVGGVVGLAGTGYAVQILGIQWALTAGALLPLFAILLVFYLQRRERRVRRFAVQV